MKKNFYHKIGVAELLAEVIRRPDDTERGKWLMALALDLECDEIKQCQTEFGKALIARTKKGRKKAVDNGKIGAKKRWEKEPKIKHIDSNPIGSVSDTIASSRSRSKRSTPNYSDAFLLFWDVYPNKIGKGKAFDVWKKSGCEKLNGEITRSVEEQKKCQQWKKDNGQFIPHPSTWLNQRRWEDEPMSEQSTGTDYGQY